MNVNCIWPFPRLIPPSQLHSLQKLTSRMVHSGQLKPALVSFLKAMNQLLTAANTPRNKCQVFMTSRHKKALRLCIQHLWNGVSVSGEFLLYSTHFINKNSHNKWTFVSWKDVVSRKGTIKLGCLGHTGMFLLHTIKLIKSKYSPQYTSR